MPVHLLKSTNPLNKEEIRLTNRGQRCIKYLFLLTKGKVFPGAAPVLRTVHGHDFFSFSVPEF